MWVNTLGKKLILYTSWFPDLAWFGREKKWGRPGSIHHVNGHMDIRWIQRGSGIRSTYEPSTMQPLDTERDSQNTRATRFVLNFHISKFVSPPHCIHLKSVPLTFTHVWAGVIQVILCLLLLYHLRCLPYSCNCAANTKYLVPHKLTSPVLSSVRKLQQFIPHHGVIIFGRIWSPIDN